MIDTLDDLCNISRIPKATINKLVDMITSIISNDVLESVNADRQYTDFDVGIGKLVVFANSSEVEYKFIPSKDLERKINSCVKDGRSILVDSLEESLIDKLLATYKELF